MSDFGEILRAIGEFGTFQKLILFALTLPNMILCFHFASVYFVQSDPERHCNTDWILRADPNLSPGEQLNLTVPREQDGSFSRCRMFVPVDWSISEIRRRGLRETTECVSGWLYHSSLYTSTIVTDFDLVCSRAYLLQVAQTVLMAGILIGCLLFGPFAESFGRKRATQIPVVVLLVFTATTGLCHNLHLYYASQFMVGMGYGGYRVNAVVLATEWIGVSRRSWGACVTQVFNAIGQCVLAGLIYMIRDWRLAQLLTVAPLSVVVIYIWFVPESARWLLYRGRTEEAKVLLARVATINKRPFPEALLTKISVKDQVQESRTTVFFRSSVLRRNLLVITFAWFSGSLTYYCLSFNMGNFGLNIFLTQLIFGLTELPVHILGIWLLEAVGRKMSLMGTLLTAGFLCFMMLPVVGQSVVITLLATSGRFLTNWAGSVCNVYIQELFPTSIRQTASGLGSIVSRIGGTLSPVVNMMALYHWSVPIVCYSGMAVVSGALCFLLPETRRLELPDSTEEAECISEKPTLQSRSTSA
ncbi:solute carrier family 22 member 13-like [Synchiropus splendidus]|uniref:solute carrier family 22 member 13-like n=1 Tax=Synchiropus splendidus TaxID=270530 RepID=UPI00237E32A1|nr:solute carrier family 22 member 13-like [Synchiropus splendidus]